MSKFDQTPPFFILNVGVDKSSATELSEYVLVGTLKWVKIILLFDHHLISFLYQDTILLPAFANSGHHFVVIIITNPNEKVLFNDLDPIGVSSYYGLEKCDFTVFQLKVWF